VLLLAAAGFVCGSVSPAHAQSDADTDDLLDGIDDAPAPPAPKPPPEVRDEALTAPKRKTSDKTQPLRDKAATTEQDQTATIDRIKAVPKKPLLKRRRLELAGMAGVSVNDPYYKHFSAGGSLVFYPHDAFGLGLGVDYLPRDVRIESPNIDIMRQSQTSVMAVFELPTWFYHVDLHWAALYGKLSLFDSFIMHFDLYTSMGFGVAKAGGRYPPMMHFAIGQRFKLAEWMAFRVELRDYVFLDTQQVNSQEHSDIQNYLMVVAGVSFFVPPTFEYTYR
jgi:outer membrane beta-barrel protein